MREASRAKKLEWVNKRGGGGSGDGGGGREAPDADSYREPQRIKGAGAPEKIVVNLGAGTGGGRSAATISSASTRAGRSQAKRVRLAKDVQSWDALVPPEKKAALSLGWNAARWDAGEDCDFVNVRWKNLSANEIKAAKVLGYDRASWEEDGVFGDDDDEEQLPDEGGEEPVMPRRERPAAGSVVVRTAPAAAPAPAPKPPATPEPKQEEEDEATLIARLEASGELPPKYVRGRPVLLLLKIEVGPGKRAALVVRQGDDPKWLAKSFCRRHNVPAQLTSVVQTNIEQNLAMLDQKK